MRRYVIAFLLFLIAGLLNVSAEIVPPVLVDKGANKWPAPPAGTVLKLNAPTSTSFTLFIPEEMTYAGDASVTLTIHFHCTAWFIQQEHASRVRPGEKGNRQPLLVGNARAADAAFETDIMKPGVLKSLLEQTEEALQEVGAPSNVNINSLELSGFSAGYAGVRGALRLPEFEPMVKRVLLGDSLYVGDGPDSRKPDNRRPRTGDDGIGPFIDFARKAAAGQCDFLMEFSTTPSMRSVGPKDCARAIIQSLDIPIQDVAVDSIPAASSKADYRLVWRADAGNAHFWRYDSPDKRPIHLSHVRNQGMMWRALGGLTSLEAIPPAMPKRPIPPPDSLPGDSVLLDIDVPGTATLFLPDGYRHPKNGKVELTVNFHATTWFVIQEHMRRGMKKPLVALELGQGSSVYRRPFLDEGRFQRLLDATAKALINRGAPPETRIDSVNITSFSAGYGAVREIIKSPEYIKLIKRIVLGDSSYGSLDKKALAEGKRVVVAEHVEPWSNFARLAVKGEKTLLMTTSEITPSTYAGTHEVARAVAESIGVEVKEVAPGSCPAAAMDAEYPLRFRADRGGFHWWGYSGTDAVVHMTLARRLAEDWEALDQCGNP